MDRTELMCGNWVSTPKGVYRVDSIQENDVIGTDYNNGEGIDSMFDAEKVNPVPLTDEILERNGFEKVQNLRVLQWNNEVYPSMIFVEYNPVNHCLFVNDMMLPKPVVFVHELQIALHICGIKKAIILSSDIILSNK